MKGLTDTEYSQLLLVVHQRPGATRDDLNVVALHNVVARHLATREIVEHPTIGKCAAYRVTPLGRLALALWPAIRTGQ